MSVEEWTLITKDSIVFDLADLTPPDPSRRYWLFGALGLVLVWGLRIGEWFDSLVFRLFLGLVMGLVLGLLAGWPLSVPQSALV
jgi:MYXO-CTERM domain-containing protein